MKLIANWRHIIRRAWSIRLLVLAGLLSGAEIALPLFADSVPRGPFAMLSFLATAAAFVARLVAQKEFCDAG